MHDQVMEAFSAVDVVIKAAAVADFRPAVARDSKIKKDEAETSLELVKIPDILKILGRKETRKSGPGRFRCGNQNAVDIFAEEKKSRKRRLWTMAGSLMMLGKRQSWF